MFSDGSLVDAVVKRIAKNISEDIPIGHLMVLIDKEKLNEAVIERVSKYVINNINFS